MINPLETYLVHETRNKAGVTLQPRKVQIMGTAVEEDTDKVIYLLSKVSEMHDHWGYSYLGCEDWTTDPLTLEQCIKECNIKAELMRKDPRRRLPVTVLEEVLE